MSFEKRREKNMKSREKRTERRGEKKESGKKKRKEIRKVEKIDFEVLRLDVHFLCARADNETTFRVRLLVA